MSCPTSNTVDDRRPAGLHRPLEHLGIRHDHRRPRRRHACAASPAPPTDDDVDPAYLPAGAASCSRRTARPSRSTNQAVGAQPYFALDEYERERVFNLHTMDANGGNITQISFNQSHDRNPVVRANGDIMFSRWEHVGARNRFAVFRVKPDGTDMFVLYGAHSARQQLPAPARHGPERPVQAASARVVADVAVGHPGRRRADVRRRRQLLRAEHAGQPRRCRPTAARRQATQQALNLGRGLSQFGRVTTPYPLWDGTNRVLVAYRPCEVQPRQRRRSVSCATLTDAEVAAPVADDMTRTRRRRQADARCRTTCRRRTRSTCSTRAADAADRRRAAGRLHVHRPGRAAVARRAERDRPDQRRRRRWPRRTWR